MTDDYNPFEPPETWEQQSRRVGRMIRENVDKQREACLLLTGQLYESWTREACDLLVGHLVNFAHDPGGQEFRVASATDKGMVTLDSLPGEFAPHLFIPAL